VVLSEDLARVGAQRSDGKLTNRGKIHWPSPLIFVVACSILSFGIGIPWIESTDSFKFAERAIRSSPSITKYVGEVRRVSIAPFYRVDFAGWGSDAAINYALVVTGTRATKTLHIVVSKENDEWKVERADFDREPVAILPIRLDGKEHSYVTYF